MTDTMTKAQAQDNLDAAWAARRVLVIQQIKELDDLRMLHRDQLRFAAAKVATAKRACGTVAAMEAASKAEAAAVRAAKIQAKTEAAERELTHADH